MRVRIAWERRGEGPPLLLVQGIGLARWGWGPGGRPPGRALEVLLYDNRGIGESDAPPGPYSIAMLAEDALQALDEAGSLERARPGCEPRGMVAQQLAVEHPESVERLVLCCTTPGGATLFQCPGADGPAARGGRRARPRDRDQEVHTERARSSERRARRAHRRLRLDKPQEVAAWGAQVAAGAGFEGVDLGRIETPTLVLHGSAGQRGRRPQAQPCSQSASRTPDRGCSRARAHVLVEVPRSSRRSWGLPCHEGPPDRRPLDPRPARATPARVAIDFQGAQ